VAVFDEGRSSQRQAIETCHPYLLRRRDLRRFVSSGLALALAITRTFAGRLREALALVEDLRPFATHESLAKILLAGQDFGAAPHQVALLRWRLAPRSSSPRGSRR